MFGIRNLYKVFGVKKYYEEHAHEYENPHAPQIRRLLKQNEKLINYTRVLDLACGNGEVTKVLKELGYENMEGADPYTWKKYHALTAQHSYNLSFQDVIRGQLEGRFSAIISSFAMHLVPPKNLYMLVHELFRHTDTVVIITPHKQPKLEKIKGVILSHQDFTLTPRGKKVYLKVYKHA